MVFQFSYIEHVFSAHVPVTPAAGSMGHIDGGGCSAFWEQHSGILPVCVCAHLHKPTTVTVTQLLVCEAVVEGDVLRAGLFTRPPPQGAADVTCSLQWIVQVWFADLH